MKNSLKVLLGILLSLCLVMAISCVQQDPESDVTPPESESIVESETQSTPAQTFAITFVDYDDTLISSAQYELGATVVAPENPVREADETYTYEFAGWDSAVVAVDGEKTYKATYTPTYIEYTVKFVDEEGNEIASATYHYGDVVEAPAFPVVTPDAVGYDEYSWDAEIVAVDGDATYTRIKKFVYIDYTVTFLDGNGDLISEATYHYGDTVAEPAAPAKDADETYTYEFAGWDNAVVAVDGNATYTATYTPTYIEYTVKFVDEEGNEIASATYHYGDTVVAPAFPVVTPDAVGYDEYSWDAKIVAVDGDATYTRIKNFVYIDYTVTFLDENGYLISEATYHYGDAVAEPAAPAKDADETYTYEFAGWDNPVVAVDGNATYTATYNPVYIDYTVRFVNYDGSILSEKTYHYGDSIEVYDGIPVRADDEFLTYEFAGWDRQITEVDSSLDYTAIYTAYDKEGYSSHGIRVENGAIVLSEGTIGGGANYTMGQNNDDGDDVPSFVNQSYFAIDGNYGLGDFIAFDFTGKNMPEVAFFAKNYDGSMYADGTSKQGIVVYTGITAYNGEDASITQDKPNGTFINYGFPFMIQDAANGGFVSGAFADSQLGRANLVDGKHYRVVMGFVQGGHEGHAAGITLKWYLYDLDENVVVEESSMASWGFFTGSNEAVNNMTLEDLVGSVVLYGKFGTTCTIDKLHGVYDDIDYDTVKNGIGKTYSVTFKDINGEELDKVDFAFGEIPAFDGELPECTIPDDEYCTYSYGWNSEFALVTGDVEYSLVLISKVKDGVPAHNISSNGENLVLNAGSIGGDASYAKGEQERGYVDQAYFAIDGEYGLDTYVAFDFTGKNLPEVAFFANNYDSSMYARGTEKEGIVVITGITTYNGGLDTGIRGNGTDMYFGHPYMVQDASANSFIHSRPESPAIARANLVDGTHYRIIMGFVAGSGHGANGITLKWQLYNLDTDTVVEEAFADSYNFFTGSNGDVGNKTLSDLVGSIVLYGKFGTPCTIDKLHGVYENATIEDISNGLNGATFTVTFKDDKGNVLETKEEVAFGATVEFSGTMPTPPASTTLLDYAYAWDKEFAPIYGDTVYTLKVVSIAKSGYTVYNVTENGDQIVLGAGNIGAGADYIKGQNAGGSITQSYLAFDGEYSFNDYIVFDFTGKNMPEVMFFGKNYDTSMYYTAGKQGVVVASGITLWDGTTCYVQSNNTLVGVSGPFGAYFEGAAAPHGGNMLGDFSAQLARANLKDGVQYRIIMGIVKNGSTMFDLKYMLYDLTNGAVVEEVTQTSWGFFTGSNESVANLTLEDLVGSIVLYGKFGTTCTIDKLHGVEHGTYDNVVAKYTA